MPPRKIRRLSTPDGSDDGFGQLEDGVESDSQPGWQSDLASPKMEPQGPEPAAAAYILDDDADESEHEAEPEARPELLSPREQPAASTMFAPWQPGMPRDAHFGDPAPLSVAAPVLAWPQRQGSSNVGICDRFPLTERRADEDGGKSLGERCLPLRAFACQQGSCPIQPPCPWIHDMIALMKAAAAGKGGLTSYVSFRDSWNAMKFAQMHLGFAHGAEPLFEHCVPVPDAGCITGAPHCGRLLYSEWLTLLFESVVAVFIDPPPPPGTTAAPTCPEEFDPQRAGPVAPDSSRQELLAGLTEREQRRMMDLLSERVPAQAIKQMYRETGKALQMWVVQHLQAKYSDGGPGGERWSAQPARAGKRKQPTNSALLNTYGEDQVRCFGVYLLRHLHLTQLPNSGTRGHGLEHCGGERCSIAVDATGKDTFDVKIPLSTSAMDAIRRTVENLEGQSVPNTDLRDAVEQLLDERAIRVREGIDFLQRFLETVYMLHYNPGGTGSLLLAQMALKRNSQAGDEGPSVGGQSRKAMKETAGCWADLLRAIDEGSDALRREVGIEPYDNAIQRRGRRQRRLERVRAAKAGARGGDSSADGTSD